MNLLSVFIKVLTQKENSGQTSTAEHLAALGTQCFTLPEGRERAAGCMPAQAQPRTRGQANQLGEIFPPLLPDKQGPAQNLQGYILLCADR